MDAYRDQYATLFRNGEKVTLVAISTDAADALASWARDADYPYIFLSDPDGTVGKLFGAFEPKYGLDDRTLFVIAPGGTISYVADPFREIDPQAYRDLDQAITAAAAQ